MNIDTDFWYVSIISFVFLVIFVWNKYTLHFAICTEQLRIIEINGNMEVQKTTRNCIYYKNGLQFIENQYVLPL